MSYANRLPSGTSASLPPAARALLGALVILLITISLAGCATAGQTESAGNPSTASHSAAGEETIVAVADTAGTTAQTVERPAGWSAASHSAAADPDYEVVYPQDEVRRLDITISPEEWQAMLDNMTDLYGERGSGRTGRPGGQPRQGQGALPDAPQPPAGQNDRQLLPGGGPGGPMIGMDATENPDYVESTLEFEGQVWTHVGIRLRGNSTLRTAWDSDTLKFSFKLDLDEFEDDYPEIDDQRFYGFKQLALVSGVRDNSLLREKLTADLFRAAGLAAPRTAFYAVYLDTGDGPVYVGLYTLVEIVEDTVIETQFEDGSGNVYKPEGQGATLAAGAFDPDWFEKQTNADAADWSDIEALFAALHSDLRTTDPAAWRANLETVFDVDAFLTWLAANTVMQNWDSYGVGAHNYYLYHDPVSDRLVWIPWDNNEALSAGMRNTLSLELSEVGDQWPLISYLLADEVYQGRYADAVAAFAEEVLDPGRLSARVQELAALIAPYVTGPQGEIEAGYSYVSTAADFEQGVADLQAHITARHAAALAYTTGR